MWPFGSQKSARRGRWNLDQPLFMLSPKDPFTIRDSCDGVLVAGGTGGGKQWPRPVPGTKLSQVRLWWSRPGGQK